MSLISFTGSVGAAKYIAGKAADSLKRLAFELGGTDAMIVMDDADLDAAADAVVRGPSDERGRSDLLRGEAGLR